MITIVGHYCPSGTAIPFECTDGTYTEIEGASMQTECKTCPSGHYCPDGSEYPVACVPGKVSW